MWKGTDIFAHDGTDGASHQAAHDTANHDTTTHDAPSHALSRAYMLARACALFPIQHARAHHATTDATWPHATGVLYGTTAAARGALISRGSISRN